MASQQEDHVIKKRKIDQANDTDVESDLESTDQSEPNENLRSEFAQAIQSKLFTFVVGEEAERFVVHTALIESISEPLRALSSLPMQESIDESATLDDIEPEIFCIFVEWLYTGSYDTGARPRPPLTLPTDETGKISKNVYCAQCKGSIMLTNEPRHTPPLYWCSDGCHKKSWRPKLYTVVASGCSICGKNITDASCNCKQMVNHKHGYVLSTHNSIGPSDQDLWKYIWSNTKLYVFADRYMILDLKAVCSESLRNQIQYVVPHADGHPESLIELLHYVYEHTSRLTNATMSEPNGLRQIVLDRVVRIFKTLLQNQPFAEFVTGGSEIAKEVVARFAHL